MAETASISADKAALRQQAERRRAGLAASAPDAGASLWRHLAGCVPAPGGRIVSAYMPIGSEIDVLPTMYALHEAGAICAMPVVTPRGQPLVFRRWSPGARMITRAWGLSEPTDDAEVLEPDIMLIPMLAFDDAGYRLGYGGGYYDRTLAAARPTRNVAAIGVAYAGQRMPHVPREATDQPCDRIVTERGTAVAPVAADTAADMAAAS